jgi:hypothetical protein
LPICSLDVDVEMLLAAVSMTSLWVMS